MSNARNFNRYLITAALPYANGPLHIGHLAGCFLPADIYVRYLRAQAKDVQFVCGADEHGVPITIRAMKENKTPQEVVDFYYHQMKNTFSDFGISFDVFSRTSNQEHRQTAQDFFIKLYEAGVFEEKETEQFYDEEKKQFLADRYIIGTCPKCGSDNAYGDQCESCGTSLSPDELLNPRSALSDALPVKKKTKHWYFPLAKYEDWLRDWILNEHKDWKSNVYGQCKSWLDQGLRSRAMTRDSQWGVAVPLPNAEGKVMYVWFDAPIGYISATKEILPTSWEEYWKQPDTKLVHFIGKDNIVFHCIIFPAMLKAHGDFILPDNVPANEFLNIEGQKVSTSRNWAVWVHEYLEDFPQQQDALRYVLCSNAPENKDNDFTWKDFQDKNNNELVAVFGNFIHRVMVLTHKLCGGKVPPFHMERKDALDDSIYQKIIETKANIEAGLDAYKFRESIFHLIDLAREGNKYLQEKEPWKHKEDQAFIDNCLHLSLQLVANLAILGNPFLPNTSQKICTQLKVVDRMLAWENAGSLKLVRTGYSLREPELLFAKIEDEQINAQIEKLSANAMDNNNSSSPQNSPLADEINFEDFNKVDLRVAQIEEATSVPKADKLLQISLNLGFEKRTVLSGIAEYFNPAEIIGKRVVLVANLAPRKMRGIMSEGMILMTENDAGQLVFVSPDEHAKLGARIL